MSAYPGKYDKFVAVCVTVCVIAFIAAFFTAIICYNHGDQHRKSVCYEQTHSTSGC